MPGKEGTQGNPYKEDFFQRIIDVQWKKRGAIFVAGDVCCFNWYIKVTVKNSAPQIRFQSLGALSFTEKGGTVGAAYGAVGQDKRRGVKGTPTFVLSGGFGEGLGESYVSHAIIMTSRDGLSWSETMHETYGSGETGSSGDLGPGSYDKQGKMFHMGSYTSQSGYGWGKGASTGVDDGSYGFDEDSNKYVTAASIGADYLNFAGGIWCRADGRSFSVSVDDMKSWQTAGTTDQYSVTCLAGGALDDFPKSQQE